MADNWEAWLALAVSETQRRLGIDINDIGGPDELREYYYDHGDTVTAALDQIRIKYELLELPADAWAGAKVSKAPALADTLTKDSTESGGGPTAGGR